jgi:Fe-S-cluster containining protein
MTEIKGQWFCRQCGAECQALPDGKPGPAISRPSLERYKERLVEWIKKNYKLGDDQEGGTCSLVHVEDFVEAIKSGELEK